MSVREFRRIVDGSQLDRGDKTWFPKWFEQYAKFVNAVDSASVLLDIDSIISFSKSLLKRGKPAWTRLQAFRQLSFTGTEF